MNPSDLPAVVRTKTLTSDEAAQIELFWNNEYPKNLSGRFGILLDDVEDYHHYLLKDEVGNIVGWAVDFEKEGETRFSIIVPASQQGKGYGKILLDSLKMHLTEFYGWVIDHNRDLKADGKPYQTPLPFYLKNGFDILKDQRIEAEIISAVKIKWHRL